MSKRRIMCDQDQVNVCLAILSRFCMFCAYTRPRYQVSVYRTIGPLVLVVTQENQSSGFPTRSDTNRAVQTQKIARGLKFRI